ncbi:acyl-CoA dehydrogenase family protein [Halalkalicoccus ordinarius]|uniref:acyl-CoA dehydrogenase family protein n=1 Tax=Halalkalicoccus ordinarius TaxID=3116651 RepID=UPI00300F3A72
MGVRSLNEEQEKIVDVAAQICDEQFAETAFTWGGKTPWENLETLSERGFYCLAIPEKYGGGGMSIFEDTLLIEEVASVCPDTGWQVLVTTIAPHSVVQFGSEEAKERYLPPICSGERQMSIGISEPEAGSDAMNMKTTLENDGDEYLLTGEKTWVGGVGDSNAAVIWSKMPDGNIGSVIMDFDANGVDLITEYENMAGYTQTHFSMDRVRIPEENILITNQTEWKDQLQRLNWERVTIAMWTNALARCAIEHALEYAQTREQFGQKIGEFQGMRWKFADMVKEYEVGRSLIYQIAATAAENDDVPDRLKSSIAKLYAAETTERIVSESLQVFGAKGYQKGHPLEYLYRYNRSRRIGHGTDEIMKNGIADQLFKHGLPK